MLTVAMAAEMCNVHDVTIRKAANAGKIPAKFVQLGKKKPQLLMREIDVMRWNEKRGNLEANGRKYATKEPEPKKIPKCRVKIGTKVKYTKFGDGRSADNIQRGRVIDKTEHLIVIRNDLGYVECFSHYDYSRGEFKAV